MKIRRWSIIRSFLFLCLLLCALWNINRILVPKYRSANSGYPTTTTYEQFYRMDRNSIDVLFLGSSIAVNAFNPQQLYNDYQIRSYNLGSEQQSVFLSYYWLKEALRRQQPRVVVLESTFVFTRHMDYPSNTSEGLTRKCLDPMRWSEVKQQAVHDICAIEPEQSELSYYLTNIRFHNRWRSLSAIDMDPQILDIDLKGYAPIAYYGENEYYEPFVPADSEAMEMPNAVSEEYLIRMAQLCREKGIKLILVNLPGTPMSDGIHNYMTGFAKDYGVDYINYCEKSMYEALGAKLPYENVLEHENIWGSIKICQALGRILQEKYDIPAIEDEQWESTKDIYEHMVKNCELTHVTELADYLDKIRDERYTVFVAVADKSSLGLSGECRQKLSELGLRTDMNGLELAGYYAVIDAQDGVVEEAALDRTVSRSGSIMNHKVTYQITSSGTFTGEESSIIIGSQEYSPNRRGMNFVIYDKSVGKVVDRVCFDTYEDTMTAVRP